MLDSTKLAGAIVTAPDFESMLHAIGDATSEISRATCMAVNPLNRPLLPIVVATLRRIADGYEKTGKEMGISSAEFEGMAEVVNSFAELNITLPVRKRGGGEQNEP